MEFWMQDESTDLSQIRSTYSMDTKFLRTVKNIMSEVEFQSADNPEAAIEKLILLANIFKEKGDLRNSLL